MKKILLTLCAVLMAVPAFAIEVYNNGENSVGIYGHVRGYMGYGMGMNGASADDHQMLYGLQGNSRIGTNIKIGNMTAQFELGANEKTLVKGPKDTIGLRQAWAAYTFANGSSLKVGKTDTPTAMGGFNSSFYHTDGGLNGFGGTVTGSRRFQVQYSIAGLTLALIEDDMNYTNGGDTLGITGFDDSKTPYTPRAGISYVFKNDSLLAKIAATYTAVNGQYTDKDSKQTSWENIHAFGIALGVKPTFGNMWVSFLARYGMNEDLYGEGGTYVNGGSFSHTEYNKSSLATGISPVGAKFSEGGEIRNVHRFGAALEFGMKATENFTAIVGAGYQATIPELEKVVHSYAVFLQGQYAFNQNFALVPEIAWLSTIASGSGKVGSESGLLVGLQFRANF